MKYKILKGFKGSQDGRITEEFKADTEVELSADLAAVAVAEGWAKPSEETEPAKPQKRTKARA